MAEHLGRRIVTVQDAIQLTGAGRRTIYYWITRGLVETIRTASGRLHIYEDSLYRQTRPIPMGGIKPQPAPDQSVTGYTGGDVADPKR